MARTEQISAFVFRPSEENPNAPEYLALRRTPARGGFWQGVTGGLEQVDQPGIVAGVAGSGSREAAGAIREMSEELQLDPARIYETGYSFSFTDPKDGELVEHVVAVEVDEHAEPTLSDEHDAAFWVNAQDMRKLVGDKWEDNVVGFDKAHGEVSKVFAEEAQGSFGPKQWALVIEKPDALELGIENEVRERLAERGLQVVLGAQGIALTHEVVDKIWRAPKDKDPWYWATVDYMTRRPVNAYLLHGDDASEKVGEVKKSLRAQYDKNYRDDETAPVERRVESIIHGSDRIEELARQALLFFPWSEVDEAVRDATRR